MEDALAWLLELRLRVRSNPEALALVDRGLAIVARAATADAETMRALERELAELGDALALRFGAPKDAVLQ